MALSVALMEETFSERENGSCWFFLGYQIFNISDGPGTDPLGYNCANNCEIQWSFTRRNRGMVLEYTPTS